MQCVAVFDLDNTLIKGDSCALWVEMLFDKSIVDDDILKRETDYANQYSGGTLDIEQYALYHFDIITMIDRQNLNTLLSDFIHHRIRPIIYNSGLRELETFKKNNTPIALISASPYFLVRPIAKALGLEHSFGSGYRFENGAFVDDINPIQPFKQGKLDCYQAWLNDLELQPEKSYFYSDSHTDLPLLEVVSNPIVIHPDAKLERIAKQRDWVIKYW